MILQGLGFIMVLHNVSMALLSRPEEIRRPLDSGDTAPEARPENIFMLELIRTRVVDLMHFSGGKQFHFI
jgi:hypothetical protein